MADLNDMLAAWRQRTARVDQLDKLFIIGCGKSGTTWLRHMLNGHPQIVVQGEGSFAWRLLPHFFQAIDAFNAHQQQGQPPVTHFDPGDRAVMARLLIDTQFARYLEHARQEGRDLSALRYVGDKTPQHTIAIGPLSALYPNCRFVHIMRDPRDVAVSGWFHDGKDSGRTFEQFIRHYMNEVWPLQVGSARRDGPPLGAGRYFELRYRDLLGDEELWLRRILDFLEVDATGDIISRCREAGSFKRLSGGRERGQEDASNFYRKGVAGDWRNHLPLELAQECCDRIADLMRSAGYDPDCSEALAGAGQRT
ncbi:MAG: sulfotransferase [Phycisphaerales bacterium]|nr:sulfotransferase [Phycisphaerales bacterium]